CQCLSRGETTGNPKRTPRNPIRVNKMLKTQRADARSPLGLELGAILYLRRAMCCSVSPRH
ncbi:MAG: hypothetical protein ACPIOQ_26320, partial [Promethearchaeia archaeon]